MIVTLAIAMYAIVAAVRPLVLRRRARPDRDPHPQVPDDVIYPDQTGAPEEVAR